MLADWFKEKLKEWKNDPEFIAEGIIIDLVETVSDLMQEKGITKEQLLDKLGVYKSCGKRFFRVSTNLKITDVVAVAKALGCKVNISIEKENK